MSAFFNIIQLCANTTNNDLNEHIRMQLADCKKLTALPVMASLLPLRKREGDNEEDILSKLLRIEEWMRFFCFVFLVNKQTTRRWGWIRSRRYSDSDGMWRWLENRRETWCHRACPCKEGRRHVNDFARLRGAGSSREDESACSKARKYSTVDNYG